MPSHLPHIVFFLVAILRADAEVPDKTIPFSSASLKATSPELVSAISPTSATAGKETTIRLTAAGDSSIVGGKAIFIPKAWGCKQVTPRVVLDEDGQGNFKINGEPGEYKVCFQAADGKDAVEQVASDNFGEISLTLLAATATDPKKITSIFPAVITVNVPTEITFEGAGVGDKATFVNAASNDCSKVVPDRDVGADHDLVTMPSTGTYVLCYRVPGASDSVTQQDISLTVRAPGVTKDMVNRWPRFMQKAGTLNCGSLDWVADCSHKQETDCEKHFVIDQGIGYQCSWDAQLWPPACMTDIKMTDQSKICQQGSCGKIDDIERCWVENPTLK
mmetsp:Transcript_17748/g.31054  ORF Transcript_17748/g.31054 Transcript_17748/m.31054 type:complete len:333 (-) Transcript_17748:265-1263(-)